MNIFWILFWIGVFCALADLLVLTFPSQDVRPEMQKKIKAIQIVFLIVCIIEICVQIGMSLFLVGLSILDFNTACLVILGSGFTLFCLLLYYPSVRVLIKINNNDLEIINQITCLIFLCIYSSDLDERRKSSKELKELIKKNNSILKEYGLLMYLEEYFRLINPTTYTAQDSMNLFILNKCEQIKYSIEKFEANPFQNIGMILSFLGSTTFVILLSLLTK